MRARSRPKLSANFRDRVAGGRTLAEWSRLNAAHAIAAGESPFRFWFGQVTIGLDAVAKQSGIERERLLDLDRGTKELTGDEAIALAPVLKCEPGDLLRPLSLDSQGLGEGEVR